MGVRRQALGITLVAALTASLSGCTPIEEFRPTPTVCYDTFEPPPCEGAAVARLFVQLAEDRGHSSAGASVIPNGSNVGALVDEDFDSSLVEGITVRALDAHGRTVRTAFLGADASLVVVDNEDEDGNLVGSSYDSLNFTVALPGTAGITSVEVLVDGKVVHQVQAGPLAPEVRNVTLEEKGGSWIITWEASDPDGDAVDVKVFLVHPDNSKDLLSLGSPGSSHRIDRRNSSGGTYRAFIVASDGLNVGWAVSPALVKLDEAE
jgi:hypothetical protein